MAIIDRKFSEYNKDRGELIKKYLELSEELQSRFNLILDCMTGNPDLKSANIFALQLTYRLATEIDPGKLLDRMIEKIKSVKLICE